MRATTCTPRAMPGATRLLAVQLGMVLAWSSGFVGYRYAMEQAPVFLTSFWRFAVCLALLLPFAWAGLRRLSARQWRRQALIGALAYAGYIAPIAKAIELGVSPGVAALMADLLPLLVALLALVLPGQRTRPGQWPGSPWASPGCSGPGMRRWRWGGRRAGPTACRCWACWRWPWPPCCRSAGTMRRDRWPWCCSCRSAPRCRRSPAWRWRR